MSINSKQRVLKILAFRYSKKNQQRSSKDNWKLAENFLEYLEKRKSLIERLIK